MGKNKLILASLLALVCVSFLSFVNAEDITISLTTPADDTWTTDTTPSFVFNATSNYTDTFNCSVYINNTKYATNATVVNATSTTLTASAVPEGKGYVWKIYCNESGANSTNSSTRTIGIDATSPSIDAFSLDKYKTEYLKGQIVATCTVTDSVGDITYSIVATKPTGATVSGTSSTLTISAYDFDVKGGWTIYCTATDEASNSATSSTLNFAVGSDGEGEAALEQDAKMADAVSNNNKTTIILALVAVFVVLLLIMAAVLAQSSKKKR